MMSGCFSPPGGGDPWSHDYEDDRLYRMSARKFNKHMAEKRRRYRINSALERLKYIILHVMRRNPEHFDKMEKADILDLTVKFLRAVRKREGTRPHPSSSSQPGSAVQPQQAAPRSSTSSATSQQTPTPNFRVYQDPTTSPGPSSSLRHQGMLGRDHRAGATGSGLSFPSLKARSGNIPAAVVRATPQDCDVTLAGSAFTASTSGLPKRSFFGRGGVSPTKRPAASTATSSDGMPELKRLKPTTSVDHYTASTSRDFRSRGRDYSSTSRDYSTSTGMEGDKATSSTNPFSLNLEYRVHSAFKTHHRTNPTSPSFPPPPTHLLLPHPPLPAHRFPPGLFPHTGLHSSSGPVKQPAPSPRSSSTTTITEQLQQSSSKTEQPKPASTGVIMATSSQSRVSKDIMKQSKTSELKIEIPEVHIPHQLSPSPVVVPAPVQAAAALSGSMWRPW